ncbi:YqzL-like protein, partial [Dysosmobacter welbionis]
GSRIGMQLDRHRPSAPRLLSPAKTLVRTAGRSLISRA